MGQPKHRNDAAHVGLVPTAQLGTETPDGSKFLRDDNSWRAVTPGGIGASARALRTRADTLDIATNAAPILIGHRGYSRAAPENTLAAFAAAIAAGVTCIEMDVHFDRANIPVVLHDATLDRTCTLPGNVVEYPAASLRTLDNGTSYAAYFATEGVPSLAEVFRQFGGRVAMIIEIKAAPAGGTLADAEDIVAALIHTFGLDAYCVIAYFGVLGGSAWATYGIPLLAYASTIASDGTIGGVSAATFVAAGYSYLGLQLGAANFTTGSAAWVAAGARAFGWTAYGQHDASQMLAAPSITGVLCSDPSYLTNAYYDAVGSTVHFAGPAMPRGVTHYYYQAAGTVRQECLQSNSFSGLTCGIAGGDRIGWLAYGAVNLNETLVCGTCRGGAAGVGKLSVSMKLEAAAADTTRFGGIGWMTDDRGHTNPGLPSSTGYFGILRANGALGLYAANSDASETVLGTDAVGSALTVGSSYTLTLEITATNVILTANGRTISVANTTYRSTGMVASLSRTRAAVSFTGLVRVS